MKLIDKEIVQKKIDELVDEDVYLHLEMTLGAYTAQQDSSVHPYSNFVKNIRIKYSHGKITDESPYRVGLKLEDGWIYTEGLTHYDENDKRIILSGNDKDGRLVVALQISKEKF
jgi:hypothetical protein